jgi:Raf kinase inhibitor-like YbhB/YbcL family protein
VRSRAFQVVTIACAMAAAISMSIAAQTPGAGGEPGAGGQGGQGRGGGGRGGPGLTLTSTAWPDGGEVPQKHAGGAMGISPALSWNNVPAGTVEFVLIMNDPEPVTPRGSATGDILHWMVVKIPATTTSLPEGAGSAGGQLPAGARQIRTYAGPGAGPAGPPHHYTLTLYALNAPLELAENADRAAVMAAMEGKVLARGIFAGRYKQP